MFKSPLQSSCSTNPKSSQLSNTCNFLYKSDKSDSKTLDILIEKLVNAKKESLLNSGKTSTEKYRSPTQHVKKLKTIKSKTGTKRKSKKTAVDELNTKKQNTLNGWLKKSDKGKANYMLMTSVNSKKEQSTTMNQKSNDNQSKNSKTSLMSGKENNTEINSNAETFSKYGVRIPTFDDIVAQQKKFQTHQQYVDDLSAMNCSEDSVELNIEETKPMKMLDCKHLSKAELKKAFRVNEQYLSDIFHGVHFSDRHSRFKHENYKNLFTTKDLKYNTSMTVFTYEQKQILLSCLNKKFNKGDKLCENSQYFFKVLLPELCTKIFMDAYDMNHEEATDYLEERPVE